MRKNILKSILLAGLVTVPLFAGASSVNSSNACAYKLFSVTIDDKTSIGDVVDNLAESCGYTVIIKDQGAAKRMNKKLYYVKMKNAPVTSFLNTILTENDLSYVLKGNKLKISYLTTKTFKIDYISGKRTGKSNAHVTIANSNNAAGQVGGTGTQTQDSGSLSKTGISIESNDNFQFWETIKDEVKRILIKAGDGSTHYTKSGEGWTDPDGQIWDYNPLEPIVNPEAGMITVTGTNEQLNRVSKYIAELSSQIKEQVLIDVKILSVAFDNSSTKGVDWSQIYGLQNLTVNSLLMKQNNVSEFEFDETGITSASFMPGSQPKTGGVITLNGNVDVNDIVKFLDTQGDVTAISSPRVMTLNNQPALISVGKELFYKIKSATTSTGGASSTSAEGEMVDSVFAGILLDITPQISKSGQITLKINPSVSETVNDIGSGETARTIPPDLSRKQIASVVKVKNGTHAILGGLISKRNGIKESKVPLLGDLPLFENAFKKTENIETVEELVIIITPHLVKEEKDVSLKDLGYIKLNR